MSVVIINGPQSGAYYTKAQLPAFNVQCSGNLEVQVSRGGVVLFTGSYAPDFSSEVEFDIKDILDTSLSTKMPVSEATYQDKFYQSISVKLGDNDGTVTRSFAVMNMKAKIASFSSMQMNFLTFQPAVKKITSDTPEYLTYLFKNGDQLKVKFYRKNGTTEVATLLAMPEDLSLRMCVTFDVSLKNMMKYSNTWTSVLKPYYDVFVEDRGGKQITNIQRYQMVDASGREQYYLFANALGGVDTITCMGHLTQSPDVEYNIGDLESGLVQLDDTDDTVNYKQNSGYISSSYKKWVLDFLMTKGLKCHYNPETGKFNMIVIKEGDSEINNHDGFTSFDFTYRMVDGDVLDFEPKPIEAQSLVVTSRMAETIEYESPARSIDIDYDDTKKESTTGVMECTSTSGMMLQVVANGYVSIYTSSDKNTWSLVETVFVEESTVRVYDYAVQGSFWRVVAECKISSIKMLI